MIILNNDGTPLYSYHFLTKKQENFNNLDTLNGGDDPNNLSGVAIKYDKHILFSGALQGVSMLLSELMGTKQHLKEIVFEDVILIIYNLGGSKISFILVAEQITKFYREALENFARNLPQNIDLTQKNVMLGEKSSSAANELVKKYFGV